MKIVPISLKDANRFVSIHHRHHGTVVGCKFAIGLEVEGILKGVAICSRPVSRKLDNGYTIEVSRLCVTDISNGCSKLYAACSRTAKGMGYEKIITYTLMSEHSISLKASGWTLEADNVGGKAWNSSGNIIRVNQTTDLFGTRLKYPSELKKRWIKFL